MQLLHWDPVSNEHQESRQKFDHTFCLQKTGQLDAKFFCEEF